MPRHKAKVISPKSNRKEICRGFILPNLNISLKQGFKNDSVVIKLNGKEIMNVVDVSSDLFGQHQQSVSVAVEEGQVTIDVSIPTRGLSDSRNLLINKDMFVGISIVKPDLSHSGIRFIFSSELLSEY